MANFEDVLPALRTGSRIRRAVWGKQRYMAVRPVADGRLALVEASSDGTEFGRDALPVSDLTATDWEVVDVRAG